MADPLSLEERLTFARARVRNAKLLAEIHPDDRAYHLALLARLAELDKLEQARARRGA